MQPMDISISAPIVIFNYEYYMFLPMYATIIWTFNDLISHPTVTVMCHVLYVTPECVCIYNQNHFEDLVTGTTVLLLIEW